MQLEEYAERNPVYYNNLPKWPNFDVFDKNIDGLIPATRLTSWDQMNEVVRHFRADGGGDEYIFRGQHHYSWFLSPTLSRLTGGGIDKELANKQLRNFKLAIRGRMPGNSFQNDCDEELWAIGQHHGLQTPLLDWTLAPYVALFFAFFDEDPKTWVDKDENPNNFSRTIFVLNKTFVESLGLSEEEVANWEYPRIVEPAKDDHGRLVNQAGLFTIAPHDETLESSLFRALTDSRVDVTDPQEVAKYLCKIHIPNSPDVRLDCLLQLRKMNIHHASLFPDVIGASLFCNELTKEFFNRRKTPEKVVSKIKVPETYAFWTEEKVLEVGSTMKPLIDALLVSEAAKKSAKLSELEKIATFLISYINAEAGVDWEERESIKARMRTLVRRKLSEIHFDEDSISDAAQAIVEKAAELSESTKKKVTEIKEGKTP